MVGIKTMTGQERDTAMASFINEKRIGFDDTLVLSGNVHSSRAERVDSWNCQGAEASSCSAHYGPNIPTDYSKAVDFPSYFVWENELVDRHGASIFIRNIQISRPFVKSETKR
jgi:hypothetical protein